MRKFMCVASGFCFFAGLIIVIGSCGALENDIIGFGRCFVQSIIGLVMMFVSRAMIGE